MIDPFICSINLNFGSHFSLAIHLIPFKMKKIIVLLLIVGLLVPVAGFSQLSKGDLMGPFSVGISYYHQNQKDLDYKVNDVNFSLSDALGIFVIDKLAIGPGLTFFLENWHSINSDETTKTNIFSYGFLFSPFARYYFAQSGKLAFFAQLSVAIGYGQDIYKTDHLGDITKMTINSLKYGGSAGVGLAYFFNDNIALETMLAYNILADDVNDKTDLDNFKHSSITHTIGINVGLSFYLQTK